MFTDRMFAFRTSDDLALLACLKGRRWHAAPINRNRNMTTSVRPQRYPCHPGNARGILQVEPFSNAWFYPGPESTNRIDPMIAAEFLDTVPHRAGLLDVDLKRTTLAAVTYSSATQPAVGYRSLEAGRVLIPCSHCGIWHVIDLDDTPPPGYRFSAYGVDCGGPVVRVQVAEERWCASWASPGRDGRRRTVEVTHGYVEFLGRSVNVSQLT